MPFHMMAALILLASFAVTPARAEPIEVLVEGEAASREAAISKALLDALQQVTGVAIAATQQTTVALSAVARDDSAATVQLSQQSQADLLRQTNGVVRSYRLLDQHETTTQTVIVHLTVVIEKYTPAGPGNDTRRRLAVAPFTDAAGKPSSQGARFQEQLTAALVQARRFAVVDRSNDAAYANEMGVIASGSTPAAERARLGQVIGADYVVVGHIAGPTSQTTETNIVITGEIARNTVTSSGRADYTVIEIATRQVKWTGSTVVSGSTESAAARIADDIIEAIYPIRVIDASDPQELVINQGGSSIKPGLRYKAYALSAEMFDPYTKESLGRREREIGTIEITRVLPKMSYARLVQGKLPQGDADIVVRKSVAASLKSTAPASKPAIPSANAPLKLPFD